MKKKLQILHLEDDSQDALLIQERITSEGIDADFHTIFTEDEFKKALRKYPIDLVLSDYSIPEFGGESALEILRNVNQDIPFIFISGTIGEEVAIDLLKSGATDYIIKNNLQRLVPSIRRSLNEHDISIRKKRS